jgi:hypothetical protein
MQNKRNIHVVPDSQDGWAVKREGQKTPIAHSQHKQDAVSKGREVAQQEGVDLIIHNRDGKIAQTRKLRQRSLPAERSRTLTATPRSEH